MNIRNTIPVCLAALLGFLLGAMFTHQTPVKAQSGLQVYVKRAYPPTPDVVPIDIPGKQVVGFSCIKGDFVECYTAYTK